MTPAALDRIAFRLLVLRCQTGDGAAFADLVRQYHPRLSGYLRGLLGRDPSDALQDVWLDVWRGLPRLTDPQAFGGWAFRIARDRAFRELRRKGVRLVPVEDVAAGEPDEFDADDAAEVRAAVDRLPPLHRDVLLLRFVEGLSYEAIAGVAGVPVGTVRSRLFHAKRMMRELLQPEGGR